jgi:hypothetical protein
MVIATVAGDYTTMLMAVYLATPGGMAVGLAGMVEKTGATSPGSTITVEVEGGRTVRTGSRRAFAGRRDDRDRPGHHRRSRRLCLVR